MRWMRDRYSVMMRTGPARLDGRFERLLSIRLLDRDEILLESADALFNGVDEGSILGDDEVWSSQA